KLAALLQGFVRLHTECSGDSLATPFTIHGPKAFKFRFGDKLEIAQSVKSRGDAHAVGVSELNNVVQLDILRRRIRSGINGDDSRLVKNVCVNAAGCSLSEGCHELTNAFFRKKEIRGKRICPHFSQVISFTLAAHHANRVLVQQDVSILMAPGEA